jgi:peptidoglycan hydrolase CwlO-like protein
VNSVQIKTCVVISCISFVLGSAVCGGIVYRLGAGRIGQLGGELEQARAANRDITNRLTQRENVVNQLATSIDRRQAIIDATERELASSRSSIAKIRAILEHLKNSQLDSGPFGARQYHDTGIDPR